MKCPVCESEEIEGGSFDVQEEAAYQEMSCLECDAGWDDVYAWTGVTNVIPDMD